MKDNVRESLGGLCETVLKRPTSRALAKKGSNKNNDMPLRERAEIAIDPVLDAPLRCWSSEDGERWRTKISI